MRKLQAPIRLHPGRERSICAKHLWIFSGAVANPSDIVDGAVHTVHSSKDEILGIAYFNKKCSIIGRMVSFLEEDPEEAIARNILQSIAMRKNIFPSTPLEMFRLVHAEADLLPGLVIDKYADVAVIQMATLGITSFRNIIVDTLRSAYSFRSIYERSTSPSRKVEGLAPFEQTLWGDDVSEVCTTEFDTSYLVDIKKGQKTGFFLDQRAMRSYIRSIASQKRVLNCFSYSGGFSLAALKGNASSCTSIDVSQGALDLLEKNLRLNNFIGQSHQSICEDVFAYLRAQEKLPYDIIILDPPAFAKRAHDLHNALKGYREINSQVMKKALPDTLLLTCSCSYYVPHDRFLAMLKESALLAKRHVRILTGHHMSPDHPASVFHPETDYLKSYLLHIQ